MRRFGLLRVRFVRIAGIAEPPGIFRERSRLAQKRLQFSIDSDAGFSQFNKIVRLAEWSAMPGEEALDRFFDSLLSVKDDVCRQRWLGEEFVGRRPQILSCLENPGTRFLD